jgi:hypothetical protein
LNENNLGAELLKHLLDAQNSQSLSENPDSMQQLFSILSLMQQKKQADQK